MLRGLYTGTAGMLATMNQMDVIANNLANVSTAGFKRDDVAFRELMNLPIRRTYDNVVQFPEGTVDRRPPVGPLGTGVTVDEIFTDFAQGPLRRTDNALDLALTGEGFFEVETPQGLRYTRDGGFQVNAQGFLVDKLGNSLRAQQPDGTVGPVRLTDPTFTIASDGTIGVGDPQAGPQQIIGTLRVASFAQPRALRKVGDNYYEAPGGAAAGQRPAQTLVKQGYHEQSNVNAVHEMVRMIEAHRLFGIEEKIITTQDGLMSKAMDIPRS